MNQIVNKTDMRNAHNAKQLLTPAIDALQKINVQSVGSVEAHENIKLFSAWLQEFSSTASEVISRAQSQYDERPQELIQAANTRLHKIPDEILLRQKNCQFATEAHEAQTFDLKHKGFSSEQISKIVDDPSSEIERNMAEIIELEAEREHILSFLADAPRFELDLLKGTTLETFLLQGTAE
ncbi:MAG: hypothetical protein ACXWT1_04725 [Methylobacter sp.]